MGAARQKVRALLTQRMAEHLSASMRDRLDALVDVGDDDPRSPLHRIKTGSSNPSVGGMKRLLARLELIEATDVLEIDVGWVNGNYQRILFHSVRTASADRVREMAAPRRHLALVCFLHQAWRDTLDQAVDMYGKLLDRNRKLVEARLDDNAQGATSGRRPDRSPLPPARRGAARSRRRRRRAAGPAAVNRARNAAARGPVQPGELDAGRPEGRFEQPAERHAGLSQFAGPFLSRMKFVDEQGRGGVADAVGAASLPRTPRGGAPRRSAPCAARLRPGGAAAAHPP